MYFRSAGRSISAKDVRGSVQRNWTQNTGRPLYFEAIVERNHTYSILSKLDISSFAHHCNTLLWHLSHVSLCMSREPQLNPIQGDRRCEEADHNCFPMHCSKQRCHHDLDYCVHSIESFSRRKNPAEASCTDRKEENSWYAYLAVGVWRSRLYAYRS